MAVSKIKSIVKAVDKTITITSGGDAVLFSGERKKVVAIVNKSSEIYPLFLPYFYSSDTRAKVMNFSASSPVFITSVTLDVTIYYID